jgi:hypothetical protein
MNQLLNRLDLSHNPIAEAGAVQLAVGIKKNAVLRELECETQSIPSHHVVSTCG